MKDNNNTQKALNKAFTNAKLESDLEKAVYEAGVAKHKAISSAIGKANNEAGEIDKLIVDCKKNDDYSPIERVGLRHKAWDFKEGNTGEKGEPLRCKAFKTAVSKGFKRAGLDKSLQGCGKGGVPKVAKKQASTKPSNKASKAEPTAEQKQAEKEKIIKGFVGFAKGFKQDEISEIAYDLIELLNAKNKGNLITLLSKENK